MSPTGVRRPLITEVTHATVLVEDTDEAIEWYTDVLGFELRTDEEIAPGVRWVTVAPADGGTELVLQDPDEAFHGTDGAAAMRAAVCRGTITVLAVDDCRETVRRLEERGVEVRPSPSRSRGASTPPSSICTGIPSTSSSTADATRPSLGSSTCHVGCRGVGDRSAPTGPIKLRPVRVYC